MMGYPYKFLSLDSLKSQLNIAMSEEFLEFHFMATQTIMAALTNNPMMLGMILWSFRHLERQNLSIISDDIGRARMVQHFQNGMERNGGMEYSCLRG